MSKDMPKTVSPFAAASAVDSIVRKLAFVPGMTPEDKQAVQRIRVQLGGIRLRHMPRLDVSGLPEDLAKCLGGPHAEARQFTVQGSRRRV